MTDERVLNGLRRQFDSFEERLAAGAERVGWKVGINDPGVQDKLGIDGFVIGFLTSETLVTSGGVHSLEGATKPAAEVEVSIELRRAVPGGAALDEALAAIGSLGPAIELVDFDRPLDDIETVLAGNVFHRAVVLGDTRQDVAVSGLTASLDVDGEAAGEAPVAVELGPTIQRVAELLEAAGGELRAGDRIIAGALMPARPLEGARWLTADLGELGTVEVALA